MNRKKRALSHLTGDSPAGYLDLQEHVIEAVCASGVLGCSGCRCISEPGLRSFVLQHMVPGS